MRQIIDRYVKPLYGRVAMGLSIKLLGSASELMLPYILAYIIDTVIPAKNNTALYQWGLIMFALSIASVVFNITANRMSSKIGSDATYELRNELFGKVVDLSCSQMNGFSKPSVITRLTTDTYNIHQMIVRTQRVGVRAPILLIGGIVITMTLDAALACILLVMIPIIITLVVFITKKASRCIRGFNSQLTVLSVSYGRISAEFELSRLYPKQNTSGRDFILSTRKLHSVRSASRR